VLESVATIFSNRDSSDRINKWTMELSEYVVDFEKRRAIKSQTLTNFVVDLMEPNSQSEGIIHESPWLICCNRAWGSFIASAAEVLISPSRIKLCYAARLQFTKEADTCTDIITEYKAILLGLHKLRAVGFQTCVLCTDLKVVSS
jgi:hypothetical protein